MKLSKDFFEDMVNVYCIVGADGWCMQMNEWVVHRLYYFSLAHDGLWHLNHNFFKNMTFMAFCFPFV